MSTGTKGERTNKATTRRERGWRARTAVFAGAALVAALSPSPADAAVGEFTSAGSITTARVSHATVLLTANKVLVIGGQDGSAALSSTQLYTPPTALPGTGTWAAGASLQTARFAHAATALDAGKALAVGGNNGSGGALSSIELYTSSNWVQSGSCAVGPSCPAPLATKRYDHTVTRLLDGTVLIVGGRNETDGMLKTVEMYDPANGTTTAKAAMLTERARHTATLLPDGKVLVVGGEKLAPLPEVYDPATDKWTPTGPMLYGGRQGHTAMLLSDPTLTPGGRFRGLPQASQRCDLGFRPEEVADGSGSVGATHPRQ